MERAVICPCGERVAPVLARLGSPWCHDCRYDQARRDGALRNVARKPAPASQAA